MSINSNHDGSRPDSQSPLKGRGLPHIKTSFPIGVIVRSHGPALPPYRATGGNADHRPSYGPAPQALSFS